MEGAKPAAGAYFSHVQRKSPAELWAAGLYKGWVSKHNPYTILKRNFHGKNLPATFFVVAKKDVDKLSTISTNKLFRRG